MSDSQQTASDVAVSPRGRFILWHAVAWALAALLAGVATARLAVWMEHLSAPLVIFPLLVGCGLGFALAGLIRVLQFGHRPTLLAGAVLAGVIAVAGQHYFSYRDDLEAHAAALAQKQEGASLAALRAILPEAMPSFPNYMRRQAIAGRPITAAYSLHGGAAWASWALDGLLLLVAGTTIVYAFSRGPYCGACGSWYRAIRSGAVRGEAAESLVEAARLPHGEPIAMARYRLSHCASGCGPARLELTWEDQQGRSRHGETWLTAADRERAVRVLDESRLA